MSNKNENKKQIKLFEDPCFQQALFIGAISGIAFVLHKHININTIKKYNQSAIKPLKIPRRDPNVQISVAFIASSCIAFSTCRIVRKTKNEKLKQTFDKIRRASSIN